MVSYLNQWRVPDSKGVPDKYIISLTYDGEYQCSCRGWTMHVPRRDCTHIQKLKANPFHMQRGIRFAEVA